MPSRPKRGAKDEFVRVGAQVRLAAHIGIVNDALLPGTLRDDASSRLLGNHGTPWARFEALPVACWRSWHKAVPSCMSGESGFDGAAGGGSRHHGPVCIAGLHLSLL